MDAETIRARAPQGCDFTLCSIAGEGSAFTRTLPPASARSPAPARVASAPGVDEHALVVEHAGSDA